MSTFLALQVSNAGHWCLKDGVLPDWHQLVIKVCHWWPFRGHYLGFSSSEYLVWARVCSLKQTLELTSVYTLSPVSTLLSILWNRPVLWVYGEKYSTSKGGRTLVLGKWLNGSQLAKLKRVFLTCPCHEIYKDEAVGLKSCKYTWKITIYMNMWNLGQFREILIFCQ